MPDQAISAHSSGDPTSTSLLVVVNNSTTMKTTLDEAVGFVTTAAGDMMYAAGARNLARLPIGTSGQVLQSTGGAPTRVGGGISLLFGRGGNTVPAATTAHSGPGLSNVLLTDITALQSAIPVAGTISQLHVRTYSAQPGDGNMVVSLMVNAASVAMDITIATAASSGTFSNTASSIAVAAGDLIAVRFTNNSPSSASAGVAAWSALVR